MENHQTTEQKRAIWQRVNPTLQPYPITAEQQAAQDAVNVCCMGAEAQEDIDVIRGFIEPANKKSSPEQDLTKGNIAGGR